MCNKMFENLAFCVVCTTFVGMIVKPEAMKQKKEKSDRKAGQAQGRGLWERLSDNADYCMRRVWADPSKSWKVRAIKVVNLSVGQEDLLSDSDRAVFMDALAAARAVTDKLVQSIFWLNVKDYEEPADFAYYRLIFSCTGENVQVSVNGKDMEVVHIEDTNYYAKLTELGAVTISCDK